MIVTNLGHHYLLENLDKQIETTESGGTAKITYQPLQFIEKVPVEHSTTNELRTVNNGTTNEEVLRVLIDRLQYLNGKFPCRENAIVITKLEESLMWLEKRTADRKARGVEGTHQK
jgi:hypothetical protein